jgi:hypothetical protein
MEKRRYPRIATKNLSVDVSDGHRFFSGIVTDVSRLGFCITDLPKNLNADVKKITVVISGRGKHFKMTVKPKWSTKDNLTKSVGAEILDVPWDWTKFAMDYEPLPHMDTDVWAGVRI